MPRERQEGHQMDKSEQWLYGGDCSICRKGRYCDKVNKPCKAARRRFNVKVAGMVASVMTECFMRGSSGGYDK